MSDLAQAVQSVVSKAAALKAAGAAANEANTKALLIEPILRALGWNVDDFAEVDREFKVFDGTFLDYALRVNGAPMLFVEAKALGKTLSDKQFIAQTVNYANNQGVVWCVLTNGLLFQVYKSNEPVVMDRKLLFEVDLQAASVPEGLTDVVASLQALRRESVSAGLLDEWGETVFDDVRVRRALAKLADDPPKQLVAEVAKALDGPAMDHRRLRGSLSRLLEQLSTVSTATGVPLVGSPPVDGEESKMNLSPGISSGAGKKTFDVEHHTTKKPTSIVDLFEQVDALLMSMGPDVARRPTKMYIGYFAGKKSFATVELQKAKLYVYLSLAPTDVQLWNEDELRSVVGVGHFGMGDTEFTLRSPSQLPRLEVLLRQSYLLNRK